MLRIRLGMQGRFGMHALVSVAPDFNVSVAPSFEALIRPDYVRPSSPDSREKGYERLL
jgi:hypothetical protein